MKLAFERALEVRLEHASTRALVFMAMTALDRPNKAGDPADVYFAGRRPIARALGYGHPDPDDSDTKAAQQAVWRAVSPLVELGLIETLEHAHSGRSAVYSLAPLRAPQSADPAPERSTATVVVGSTATVAKGLRPPFQRTTPTVDPYGGNQEETKEEITMRSGFPRGAA